MAWGRRIFHLLGFAKMFRLSLGVAVIFLFGRIHTISGECRKVRRIKHEQVLFESFALSSQFGRPLMCKGFFEKQRYLIVLFFSFQHEALLHNFQPMYYIDQRETIQVGLSFVKNSTNIEKEKVYRYVAQFNSRSSFKLSSQFSLHA